MCLDLKNCHTKSDGTSACWAHSPIISNTTILCSIHMYIHYEGDCLHPKMPLPPMFSVPKKQECILSAGPMVYSTVTQPPTPPTPQPPPKLGVWKRRKRRRRRRKSPSEDQWFHLYEPWVKTQESFVGTRNFGKNFGAAAGQTMVYSSLSFWPEGCGPNCNSNRMTFR